MHVVPSLLKFLFLLEQEGSLDLIKALHSVLLLLSGLCLLVKMCVLQDLPVNRHNN